MVSVRGTTLGAQSDGQGNFRINGIPAGVHSIVISKPGFERKTIDNIRVASGQVSRADARLNPVFQELEPVEFISDPPQELKSVELLVDRQESAAMEDSIGSDFISRAGANTAADAMKKVTGATVVGGKYTVIRGLGDRYSNTQLNGSNVPSPDPDRKAVQMDIFPASAIDSIVTSKTFTPDKPGSFSGGSVNIKTKSFPDEWFASAGVGTSYNTQVTGTDDFLTTPGDGKWDWAGFDDGTRDIPSIWGETGEIVVAGQAPPGEQNLITQTGGSGPAADAAAAEVTALGQSFFPRLTPVRRDAPVNHNFSFSTGDSVAVTDNATVGYLAGVSYDRSFSSYDNGTRRQFRNAAGVLNPSLDLVEAKSTEEVSWGSLVNVGARFYEDHEITFNFLYNRNSEDTALSQLGFYDNAGNDIFENYALAFIEREIQSYQLAGEHALPIRYEAKTEWSLSFASTLQNEPDRRFFGLDRHPVTGTPDIDSASYLAPTRFFRTLHEDNFTAKLDQTIPFELKGRDSELKFGVHSSRSKREYEERRFTYLSQTDFGHLDQADDFVNPDAFDPITFTVFGRTFRRYNLYVSENPNNLYTGELMVDAGYGMFEVGLTDRLKFIGGVRAEASTLSLDASGAAVQLTGLAGSSQSNLDLLPAGSFVFEVRTNMNVRIAYGQTLARPTFREISPVSTFDFIGGDVIAGNPNLEQTSIKNYDIRWEWFPRPGEILAGSFFYKTLTEAIEKEEISANNEVTYANRDEATVFGFEAEFRKNLDFLEPQLTNFNFGANFSYIRSAVTTTPFEFDLNTRGIDTRPLQGQSPYIINLDLTYHHPDLQTTASVFFNIFGKRLEKTSRITPSVFESSFASVDFRLSQKITENWTIKISAQNLLDPTVRRVVDQPNGTGQQIVSSFRKGRSVGVSLNYDF